MNKFIPFTFLILFQVTSFAQTFVIGNGTLTTNGTSADPIDGYYHALKYQMVFKKSELSTYLTPNDQINAIGFSISEDFGGGDLKGYTIKMGHSTSENAAQPIDTEFFVVKNPFDYNPNLTNAGEFEMIALDSPFIWNGAENLVVEICTDGSNAFIAPYGGVRTSNYTNGSRFFRIDNDTACEKETNTVLNNRPNTSFQYTDGQAPDCILPSFLNVSSIGTEQVDLQWVENGSAVQWEIELVTYGISMSGIPTHTAASNPFTLNNLTPGTTYSYRVRSVCDTALQSEWSSIFSFTTACTQFSEFHESFDNPRISSFPNCWSKVGNSGAVLVYNTDAYSGTSALYLYSLSTTNTAMVKLPEVSNLGDGTHWLRFKMKANFSTGTILDIGYLNEPEDANTFVSLGSITALSNTYNDYYFIPTPETYTAHLSIRNSGNPGYSVLIDDVHWEEIPTCPEPSEIVINQITGNTAVVQWNLPTTVDSGNIQYGPSNFTLGNGTLLTNLMNNQYELNGLAYQMTYDVYVQSNCGGGQESSWMGPYSFATLLPAPINDFCVDALPLEVGIDFDSQAIIASNVGATASQIPSPDCANYLGGDVWYWVTVPISGNLTIETNPADAVILDTGLAIYDQGCYDLTLLDCDDDDSAIGYFSKIVLTELTPGNILHLRLWEYGNNAFGIFKLSAFDCPSATPSPSGNSIHYFCNETTLNDLSISGTDIKWYDASIGGNEISGETLLENEVSYYASQTLTCESYTRLQVTSYLDCSLAQTEIEEEPIKLFPNPAFEVLYWQTNEIIHSCKVFNALGQMILSQNDISNQLDISHLNEGFYLIKFETSSEKNIIRRFYKEK